MANFFCQQQLDFHTDWAAGGGKNRFTHPVRLLAKHLGIMHGLQRNNFAHRFRLIGMDTHAIKPE